MRLIDGRARDLGAAGTDMLQWIAIDMLGWEQAVNRYIGNRCTCQLSNLTATENRLSLLFAAAANHATVPVAMALLMSATLARTHWSSAASESDKSSATLLRVVLHQERTGCHRG